MKGHLSVAQEELLDLCRKIEEKMEEYYLFLMRLHASNARISALWRKTAMEERSHVMQFVLSRRASREAMVADVVADPTMAEQAMQMLQSELDGFKEKNPDVETALHAAIHKEEVLHMFHMEYAVTFTRESHRNLFHAMMAADRKHIESLKLALGEITGSTTSLPQV